jgi:hypothetical protein
MPRRAWSTAWPSWCAPGCVPLPRALVLAALVLGAHVLTPPPRCLCASQAYLDHFGHGKMAWAVIAAIAHLGLPGGAVPVTRAHAAHTALAPLFAACPYSIQADGAIVAAPRSAPRRSSTPFVLAVRAPAVTLLCAPWTD